MTNTCKRCGRPQHWGLIDSGRYAPPQGSICSGEGGLECVTTERDHLEARIIRTEMKSAERIAADVLVSAELREAWATCPSHLDRFEAVASLYAGRYGRLAPGKSDVGRDSNDPENMARFEAWASSPLALYDASMMIARLEDRERELVAVLDEHDIVDPEDTRKKAVFS